jgi:predicted small lipoprotein YifL
VFSVAFVVKTPSWSLAALAVVSALAAGCGKKGPPLAPIVRIPAAVEKIQATRRGGDVFVTLTVPDKNIDTSIPVDIGRVEIYGYTGPTPPPRTRWAELGDLVTTIPVASPPADAAPDAAPATDLGSDLSEGVLPGMVITVRDRLTPATLVQGRVDETPPRRGATPVTPVAATPQPGVLRRFYVAFAFSRRGRPGPPGTAADFPLFDAPEPPPFIRAPYSESTVTVEWPPSGGIIGFLFDRALGPEEPPLDEAFEPIVAPPAAAVAPPVTAPAGPVHYNVYRDIEPDPLAFPDATAPVPWIASAPAPVNPAPLDAMTFTDPVEFGRERCYVVRALRGTAPNVLEGDPSEPVCVTPTDIFPPAAPARLVAVADEGGISLIWEPNAELDLGGYLVLRGEASDATLQTLTPAPIAEARFRDTTVMPGKKYVYAVLAVDSRLPVPNISAESNRVEETAR